MACTVPDLPQVMSREEARREARALLLAEDDGIRVVHSDRFIYHRHLVRRVYRCQSCGHETLTVGGALPEPTRCFKPLRHDGFRVTVCGGTLFTETRPAEAFE